MWDCNSTQMCTARKHSKHCPPKHHWRANTKYKWNPDAEALSASASEALSGSCTPTRCSSQGKDMFNVQFWGDVQKCTCSHTLDQRPVPQNILYFTKTAAIYSFRLQFIESHCTTAKPSFCMEIKTYIACEWMFYCTVVVAAEGCWKS